jgi:hypothetical protein
MVASTRPVFGSIFWMRSAASWNRYWPSKAVPAFAATSIERSVFPVAGSKVQPVSSGKLDVLTVIRDSMHVVDTRKGSIFTNDFAC